MRDCVIGGAGFIGSHIVDNLVEKGREVLVLDNLKSGSLKNINKNALFVNLDIRESEDTIAEVFEKYNVERVFHLAAEPYIPECYERPKDFFEVNANGTMNVLLACKKAGVKRILYFSTSEVYGTGRGNMDEKFPLNPQSTYAVSKLSGDRIAFTLYKEQEIPVIILRQFNCYGERETHEYVIPEIISQLTKTSNLKLGNIDAKRDFMYVKDAAEVAVRLMEKGVVGEVYNSGSGSAVSIRDLAYMISRIMKRGIFIQVDKKRLRPFDVEYLKADTTKIERVIGVKPKTPLSEGLRKTIKWFYENGKKWGFEK